MYGIRHVVFRDIIHLLALIGQIISFSKMAAVCPFSGYIIGKMQFFTSFIQGIDNDKRIIRGSMAADSICGVPKVVVTVNLPFCFTACFMLSATIIMALSLSALSSKPLLSNWNRGLAVNV